MTNIDLWIAHFRSQFANKLSEPVSNYSDAAILHIAYEQHDEIAKNLVNAGVFKESAIKETKDDFIEWLEESKPDRSTNINN